MSDLADYHLEPPGLDPDACPECYETGPCHPDCVVGGDVPCGCGARPALGEECESWCRWWTCLECGAGDGDTHSVSCPYREPEPLIQQLWSPE